MSNNNSLQSKAVLAYLTVRLPSQSKTDRQASREVDGAKHAAAGSAKVTKRLFSKESFGPLQNAAQALRFQHYKLTLAWDDTGARILPIVKSLDYQQKMQVLKDRFFEEARAFNDTIEETLAEEELRLGDLFRREDYPANPLAQCAADWTWRPVPVGDFRECGWDEETARAVATKAEHDLENGLVRSLNDAYSRIKDVVGKVAEKLADQDAIFRNSLIDNVGEVLDTCDSLNIFGDAGLARIISDARSLLVHPDRLRNDKIVRADVSSRAQALMDALEEV